MKAKEVIILGGGLSGLTAAYELEKAGINYRLYEASNRLGGRIHTLVTPNGNKFEMGATWFSDRHHMLIGLIKELSVAIEKQFHGKKVLYDYHNQKRTQEEISIPVDQEPSYVFSNGTVSLINALANRLNESSIHYNQIVESIQLEEHKWQVVTSQDKVDADVIINTLPPNLFINQITISPYLPESLVTLCQQTHTWMGESIKVGLELDDDPWRLKEIGMIMSQFGPASELHDHRRNHSKASMLTGFIHPAADLVEDERKQKISEQLSHYFPDLTMVDYHEFDWATAPFTFQPYQTSLVPHQNNGHPLLREPLFDGQLYFAGSETARSFPGYMDGAVERGKSVVRQILGG